MRRSESVELQRVELTWLGPKAVWVADRRQQSAAWELYVELATRISIERLADDDGTLREALSSLYSIFGETRQILKRHGPSVARPLNDGYTFAQIALIVLNSVLRPLLAKWHPQLQIHEAARPQHMSVRDHEHTWQQGAALRSQLRDVQETLDAFAESLALAAGVPVLHRMSTLTEKADE